MRKVWPGLCVCVRFPALRLNQKVWHFQKGELGKDPNFSNQPEGSPRPPPGYLFTGQKRIKRPLASAMAEDKEAPLHRPPRPKYEVVLAAHVAHYITISTMYSSLIV